ncbi:putative glycosyl transferase [Nautilia profundicola AmH]|uniref:Glycosyl transferase n=1 Tax=Nautilia profundicola (strain ATCC BAA-1463 / DSM 18972 / AmH) TaxID=598659 RepID=B9L6Q1_NAUPA|nr:glycosyltransferase family 4 protein [Nautilia profundicola]ACM92613.1 putative glycosyl transferase [Nautilia profundicola AmH]
MNVLYISRNIPIPGIKENDIILRIANAIEEKSDIHVDCFFPKEVIPKIPFMLNNRIKAIYNLPPVFKSLNKNIFTLKYIRLPFFRYSYNFINSFKILNKSFLNNLNKYKVIHAHNIMPDGKIGYELKKQYFIPLIVTVRNGDLDKMSLLNKNSVLYKSYLEVLKNADVIITHNYATQQFIKKLGLKSTSIPHGIESKYLLTKKIEKENIILFVGNMIPRKNLIWVINAFKKINKLDWKLIIIGDGTEYDQIREKIKDVSNIELKGRLTREEVINYMKISKIFAMPSQRETFGIVYLEAAASKCLVIGHRYTGIYGWLKEDKEAIFVENEEELKEKLQILLNNEEMRHNIAMNGFIKIKKSLLWEDQINKYINLYRNFK